MKILNFGSLNIDKVYTVPHFVKEGETLSSTKYEEFPGGKGLNQSVALAKAGTNVFHAGKIGIDGLFLKETLNSAGVNTENIIQTTSSTGHAIIQVDDNGDNCILLFSGANRELTESEIDTILNKFSVGDLLVLQNEINSINYIIHVAHKKGLTIALNPSPMNDSIKNIDFSKITYLILNEIEGKEISGEEFPDKILNKLLSQYSNLKIVLTLGKNGCMYKDNSSTYTQSIYKTTVVDTTAAGDTFMGYFLSLISTKNHVKYALEMASKASSLAVSRKGASTSIPLFKEVLKIK